MARKTTTNEPNVSLRIARRRERDLLELRTLIAAAGLTQHQAAAALGKGPRIVEYWLSGQQPVPRVAILAMRYVLEHGVENS